MKNKTIVVKVTTLLLLILGGSGLCLADNKAQASDWYSPDWGYRKAITVNNTSSAVALTDYQVLVTLSSSNFDYGKANTDGSDLRFTDSDELTEISYWIEEWNISGDSKVWVKVPSILASSTATVYLYYGNSSATTSLSSFDDTMQKLEVDAATIGLWHFDSGTGSTVVDSSTNGNDGTMLKYELDGEENITRTPRTDSWVADSTSEYGGSGGALNFDGNGDYVDVGTDSSLDLGSGNYTVEGWIKTIATGPQDLGIVSKYADGTDLMCDHGIRLYLWEYPEYIFYNKVADTEGDTSNVLGAGAVLNDGEWHHFAASREGLVVKSYIDGKFEGEGHASLSTLDNISTEATLVFGQILDEAFFNGQLDEFKITKRLLSDEEIKADYEKRQYTAIEPTNSLGTEETTPYDATETVIAVDGGTVANTADTVEVTIPADALSSDTDVTIETGEDTGSFQVQGAEPVDYIYDFGPEGTEFSSPVTLTFNYDDTEMTLEEENNLDIYYYNTETSLWEAQGAIVDTTLNILTLSVDHFSEFIIAMNVAASGIDTLLSAIDGYSDGGEIGVEVNGGRISSSTYFLKVHLKRAQKLIREGRHGKAEAVLNKFVEKVERFTPHLISDYASGRIITDVTGTNGIIELLE